MTFHTNPTPGFHLEDYQGIDVHVYQTKGDHFIVVVEWLMKEEVWVHTAYERLNGEDFCEDAGVPPFLHLSVIGAFAAFNHALKMHREKETQNA